MKLRFDHQSIRLRVRKSDIAKLSQENFVSETVHFPQGALTYRLEMQHASDELSVAMNAQNITVAVPAKQAQHWIDSEEVGIYATLNVDTPGQTLQVLIEKDFPCRHTSTEDKADTFEELEPK